MPEKILSNYLFIVSSNLITASAFDQIISLFISEGLAAPAIKLFRLSQILTSFSTEIALIRRSSTLRQ
jgi:hypothetical protein